MADDHGVFASGTEAKRNMLKQLWPELYDALAGLGPGSAGRKMWCVVGGEQHSRERHEAVGRLGRMGHPVCQQHADMVGGQDIWPLPASENKPKGRS